MNVTMTKDVVLNGSNHLNSSYNGSSCDFDNEKDFFEFQDNLMTDVGYLTWILFAFGSVGSVLTVIAMRNKKTSTATLLSALAVSDCFVLIVSVCMTYMVTQPFTLCLVVPIVRRFNIEVSAWILVVLTMERVLSVAFPFHVKTFFTIRSARIQVILICLSVLAINSLFLIGTEVVDGRCIFVSNDAKYLHKAIMPWKDIIESFLLPSVLIFIGNAIIVINFAKAASKREKLTSSKSIENSITTTLVTVSCVFCLTNLPIAVTNLYMLWHRTQTNCDLIKIAAYFDASIECMVNVNACVNFYLYILSGSAFRNDIRNIFKPQAISRQNSNSQAISTQHTNVTNCPAP